MPQVAEAKFTRRRLGQKFSCREFSRGKEDSESFSEAKFATLKAITLLVQGKVVGNCTTMYE